MDPAPPIGNLAPAIDDPDINPFTGEDLNPERLAQRRRRGRIRAGVVIGVVAVAMVAFSVFVWRDNRGNGPLGFRPPERVGTLTRRNDEAARAKISSWLNGPIPQQGGPAYAAIYADSANPGAEVTVGQSAWRPSETELDNLKYTIGQQLGVNEWRWVAAGKVRGQEACAEVTRTAAQVVCVWADDAGSGIATFARRPLIEAGPLLNEIRAAGTSR
ncbi:MAG: hypothetical protein QOD41_3362 [Cryptosporangiaceae bacterium]|nr:hypothetical protein [Cryptosporangiaceae bacterium]